MHDKPPAGSHRLRNKVPEVTIFFWIIKILCTTVGETAADFLNVNMNLGLTDTSIVMGVLLAIVLAVQFRTIRYVAPVYWLAVVLISVFGTLVTDNLARSPRIKRPPARRFRCWMKRSRIPRANAEGPREFSRPRLTRSPTALQPAPQATAASRLGQSIYPFASLP